MSQVNVSGLSFGYAKDADVLTDIDLSVDTGEVVLVVGPNGSGKSTLLKLLVGPEAVEHRAHRGDIRFGERNVTGLSPLQRARWLAYLPQVLPQSVGLTCDELVRLGRQPQTGWSAMLTSQHDPVVDRAFELCEIAPLRFRQVDDLSGGEKQRVMLAAAVAQQAPVLALDEPSSALDLRYALRILRIQRQLADESGTSVLIASHDINLTAPFADRVVVLSKGSIAAMGAPGDVLTKALFAEVYQLEVELVHTASRSLPLWVPLRELG